MVGYQGSAAVYHPQKNALRFFGGQTTYDRLFSTYNKYYSYEYVLNSSTWSPSAPLDTDLEYYFMATYHNASNYIISHGGLYPDSTGECITGEFRILDLACNTWSKLGGIKVPRTGHSIIQRNGSIYIFGGNDGTLRNQVDVINIDPFINSGRNENDCIGILF